MRILASLILTYYHNELAPSLGARRQERHGMCAERIEPHIFNCHHLDSFQGIAKLTLVC